MCGMLTSRMTASGAPAATRSKAARPSPPAATSSPPPPPRLARPHIVRKPIPFSAQRLAETAAYAKRHYGVATWHLHGPHVIVEHYTESTTMMSAWSTFAQDVPDSELHELPG